MAIESEYCVVLEIKSNIAASVGNEMVGWKYKFIYIKIKAFV